MGAFQGEWHINLVISPTTCFFCSFVFALVFNYFKDSNTQKITQFGALAGQIQHMAAK
jgi:hypothetical protein